MHGFLIFEVKSVEAVVSEKERLRAFVTSYGDMMARVREQTIRVFNALVVKLRAEEGTKEHADMEYTRKPFVEHKVTSKATAVASLAHAQLKGNNYRTNGQRQGSDQRAQS